MPNSSQTGHDDFILTDDEAKTAIDQAKVIHLKNLKWKFRNDLSRITDEMIRVDEEEILQRANRMKHHEQRMEAHRRAEMQREIDEAKKKIEHWTAGEMYRYLGKKCREKTGKDFQFDEGNKEFITKLCHFLANKKIQSGDLDLSKGLWVKGKVGRGKTFPILCLKDNDLNPYPLISMSKIAREVQENGHFALPNRLVALDDVGTETMPIKHFGTEINWFKNLIEERSLNMELFSKLIVSTNLSFDDIEVCYGERVRSRIAQMFNIIDVTGEDRRRQK